MTACYWARIPRVVFAATSQDVAASGFEDLQLYRELTYDRNDRSLQEDTAGQDLHNRANEVLKAWAAQLPGSVEAKY